jgi:hypothetical protein
MAHPQALFELRRRETEESTAALRAMLSDPDARLPTIIVDGERQSDADTRAELENSVEQGDLEPEVGSWPLVAPAGAGLSVANDILSGRPHAKLHIVLLPASSAEEAPAYLRWGGWNACPPPEYHVAAFRSWRERYGAEVIGMSGDVLNIRVQRRPATRAEALDLAREQYVYCSDLIDQGVATLSNLAAALMADDWWYFWWD